MSLKWTGGLVVAAGVVLAMVRFFGMVPAGRNLETLLGAAAFGTVIAAPGVLALLSLKERPALLLPAALLLVPLSFLSFALVTLPLLIPAFLLFRTFTRATQPASGLRVTATTAVVLALLFAALVALFIPDDPREYTTATSSYSTSDVISYGEAALSLTLTAIAVGLGWALRPEVHA